MKYCLLKIAYDESFYGFQIQPNLPTVQGEILKALSPIGIKKIYGSSRTDSHVRSSSSIIEVQHEDSQKVCKIVDSIRGIAVRGYYETDNFVNLRRSLKKEYLYFCDRALNETSLKKTIREFLSGELTSFSRDPAKKVVLSRVLFFIKKTHTLLLFEGMSFSWNFVRISAETIIRRSEGKVSDEEWRELLTGKKKAVYKGKASNLILLRTSPPFEFRSYKSKNLNVIRSRIIQDFYWLSGINDDVRELTDSLDFLEAR